jgi:hypothetical protein
MTERLIQSSCEDSRLDAISQALLQQATQCVTTKGVFNLLLSDSEELDAVYARLMYDPDLRAIPWAETQLWFLRGTEESVVTHSGILEEHVHTEDPEEQIDCCVLTLTDIESLKSDIANNCVSFLVYASSMEPTDWQHSGVAHWFC